jgi:hypothetical protein
MNSRILTRIALAATLFAAFPAATTAAPKATATPSAAANAQHLANLQTKGSTEIARRIANLTSAQAKLDASTKLSPADKSALDGQITAELAGLNTLKTKLAAETTIAPARLDVTAIVSDYRVYVLMLPKVRLVATTDRFNQVESQLTALASKLQTKVDAQKAAGKDVTAAQTALTDLTAKTTDATTKTSGIVAPLLAIQPADYNANHAALTAYRTTLQAAHADIVAARSDAITVVAALKATQ